MEKNCIENNCRDNDRPGVLRRIVDLYVDGFRSMTVGRKLWLIILIKLFVMFFVFKLFFFPDILESRYATDAERAEAVRQSLTTRP
ncbi:MAG: DUF4492 domain-containing protein [Clostridium sp.]|nr:DUF4492 domain-containing protein [Clostridium sp.]